MCCDKAGSGAPGKESQGLLRPAWLQSLLAGLGSVHTTGGSVGCISSRPISQRREQGLREVVREGNQSQPNSELILLSFFLHCFVQHFAAGHKPSKWTQWPLVWVLPSG